MLHLRAPDRWDGVASIIGDRDALETLRRAVDAALATGAGGTTLFNSDGESYALAVALEDRMWNVQTAYAGEATPVRSLREVVPMHAVENFPAALCKALIIGAELDPPPVKAGQAMERRPTYAPPPVSCPAPPNLGGPTTR